MISTKQKWPRRSGSNNRPITGAIIVTSLLLVMLMFGLGFIQRAHADTPGGNPSRTPTRTPKPTNTATITPTFTQPPTLTSLPQVYLPGVSNVAQTPGVAKALPTGTLLSLEEISGTLAAPNTQPAGPSSVFWIYVFILFLVAAAVVVAVIIGLMRQRNQNAQNPPDGQNDQNQP